MIIDRIRSDTELAQSLVRFALGTIVIVYLVLVGADIHYPAGAFLIDNLPLCLGLIYAGASAITAWTWFNAGEKQGRRVLAMLYDYGLLGSFMMTGGGNDLSPVCGDRLGFGWRDQRPCRL